MSERLKIIEVEENSNTSLEQVFVGISKLAEIRNQPVTNFAPFNSFLIFPEPLEGPQHLVRINVAAADKNGKPRLLVIDADYDNTHMQQIVVEAEWNDNKPTIITNAPSKMHGAKTLLPYEVIEAAAKMIVDHKIEHAIEETRAGVTKTTPPADNSFYIRMPESYGKGNN